MCEPTWISSGFRRCDSPARNRFHSEERPIVGIRFRRSKVKVRIEMLVCLLAIRRRLVMMMRSWSLLFAVLRLLYSKPKTRAKENRSEGDLAPMAGHIMKDRRVRGVAFDVRIDHGGKTVDHENQGSSHQHDQQPDEHVKSTH